jgi:hypothetical protein
MDTPQPPPLWQSDVVLTPLVNGAQAVGTLPVESSEHVGDAWNHVKQVVLNSGKEVDLYDMLSATRRDDTYQPHVPTVHCILIVIATRSHLLIALTHAVASLAEAVVARDGRSTGDGAREVPRLSDHVLLRAVSRDRARMGISGQLAFLVALRQKVSLPTQ